MQGNTSITMLDTSIIIPNKYQPRKVFDERAINTLSESIKQYGIINPILVRKKEDKYEIIAGERRYRAAKLIGLKEVPVIIKNADEQEIAELALIENIQRQELSPIEEAKSYEEIMRIGNQTQESLAKKIGKSQATIANKIRLLSLPEEIQDALAHNKISERHARSLLSIKDKERQIELLNRIISEKLTVKDTERIINSKEIEEEEIKQAISDIMKSLDIKEEEKEDDNMNNGNFFPNFDNNNPMNNNTSLNMMNMQSMNQPPMEAAPEMVMPTANPIMNEQPPMQPQMNPMPQPMANVMESVNQPMPEMNNNFNPMEGFMNPQENLIPQPTQNIESAPMAPTMEPNMMMNPTPEQPMNQPEEQSMINNVPLFGMQPETSEPTQNVEQASIDPQIEPTTPMFDVPLFNQNAVMPSIEPEMSEATQNVEPAPMAPTMEQVNPIETPVAVESPAPMEQNSFEIPVINEQPAMDSTPIQQDKLSQLQEYLNTNGYTYKTFSNDTENCIIIELPRN